MSDFIFTILLLFTAGMLCKVLDRVNALRRAFPNCDHDGWHIDTQLRIMWCGKCRRGNWYTVKAIEGENLAIESERTGGK